MSVVMLQINGLDTLRNEPECDNIIIFVYMCE